MPSLLAIRQLHRRHHKVARWLVLALLAVVTLSTMPRWVTHAHDRHQASGFVFLADQSIDQHDAEANATSPDAAHSHAHFLAGAAFTLPAQFNHVRQLNLPGNRVPAWRNALMPQGQLTTLHRPPIV